MAIIQEGIDLIKEFEGLELKAYQCPAGIWTIGYGHTTDVLPGQTITEQDAEDFLRGDLISFEAEVNNFVIVPVNDYQKAALVSFTYNLGSPKVLSSTMLRKLNAGNYDEVPFQMKRWNKAYVEGKKVVLKGLVRRREAEANLFTKEV